MNPLKHATGFALTLLITAFAARADPNYDESKVGTYTLPDPLIMQNGKPVLTKSDWVNTQRPEILKVYRDEIFGHSPARPKMAVHVREMDRHALDGKAIRKQVDLEFHGEASANKVILHVLLYTPAGAKKPVPTFLCLSFSGNYAVTSDTNVLVYPVWDKKTDKSAMPATVVRGSSHSWRIEDTLARGYGIAIVNYNDIEPDFADGTGWRFGVRSLYLKPGETREPDAWGAISAWAWGASRVMDYLVTDENVDAKRVIMTGHSRLGKTALWAGAQDARFAIVIASCSGEMGAALSRRDYGETVTTMCKSFPYQFAPNFLQYANNIPGMPVDSNMLVSLVAPRPLYLNTGSLDRWSDPRGEFEAAIAAAPVWRLFGKQSIVTDLPPRDPKGGSGAVLKSDTLEAYAPPPLDIPIMRDVGYQTHTGKHDILPEDWERFWDFADLHFYGKPPRTYPLPAVSGSNAVTTGT